MTAKHVCRHRQSAATWYCRCNTAAFKSSSTDWKKKAASDAQTVDDYNQLFGKDTATVATDKETSLGAAEDDKEVAPTAAIAGAVKADAKKSKKGNKAKHLGDLQTVGVKMHATDGADTPLAKLAVPEASGAVEERKPSRKHKKGKADIAAAGTIDGTNDGVEEAQPSKKHKKARPASADTAQGNTEGRKLSKKQKKVATREADTQGAVSVKQSEQDKAMAVLGFASNKQQQSYKKQKTKNKKT